MNEPQRQCNTGVIILVVVLVALIPILLVVGGAAFWLLRAPTPPARAVWAAAPIDPGQSVLMKSSPLPIEPTTQNAEANRRVHVFVSGRVQGVGFRNWTQSEATRLQLTGYVLNRSDGRVEAVIEGPTEQVGRLIVLLSQGPAGSRVDKVELADEPPTGEFTAFDVRR